MVLVRVDVFLIDAIPSLLLRSVDIPPIDDSLFALTLSLDGASRELVTILAKGFFVQKTRELSTGTFGESADLPQ